jgi:SAM-dependent methyltransferase
MDSRLGCRLPRGRQGEGLVLAKAAGPLPLLERLHLLGRWTSAPWERLVPSFSPRGDLLDVGCGPGLLAHLLRRAGFEGIYTGIDPDSRKVARARRWLGGDSRSRFEASEVEAAPAASFDQIAIIDVLYLIPGTARRPFLERAIAPLRPGGSLVVLTSGGGPAWKRRLDRGQERLAALLGVTRGAAVDPCDGEEIASLLRDAGLERVTVSDAGSGYLHGFELVEGRLPDRR